MCCTLLGTWDFIGEHFALFFDEFRIGIRRQRTKNNSVVTLPPAGGLLLIYIYIYICTTGGIPRLNLSGIYRGEEYREV